MYINSVQRFIEFTQSNEKLNLNSQQLHFPPPQVHDTDIKSLRSCCREEGKKRVTSLHQGFTNWNHVFHRWKSSARWQRGSCTPVMRALLSSNTAEPPLKHGLGQGRRLRWGQAGQRANKQGANWIWPSVTSDDRPSVWRRRGQRTKIKTEHKTTTKFLYKQPSFLLQTLNEQELHDGLIK